MNSFRFTRTFEAGDVGSGRGDRAQIDALCDAAQRLLDTDVEHAYELSLRAQEQARETRHAAGLARATFIHGLAIGGRGDLVQASETLESAERLYVSLGDTAGQVEVLSAIGKLLLDFGESAQAEERLGSALTVAREHAFKDAQASILNRLCGAYHMRGAYQEALDALGLALELRRGLGDKAGEASCLCNIGNTCISLGRYPEALDALMASYTLYRDEVHDPRTQGRTVVNLGSLFLDMGDRVKAHEYFDLAATLGRECGDRLLEVVGLLNVGTVQLEERLDEQALRTLQDAQDISRTIGYQPGEISALDGIGQVLHRQGDVRGALASHRAALDIARQIEDVEGQLDALHHTGRLLFELDDTEAALGHLEEGLSLARSIDRRRSVRDAHLALFEVYRRLGEFEQALNHHEAYFRSERELFNEESERKTRALTVQFDVERARHEAEVYRLRTETEQHAREAAEALVRERTAELERAQLEIASRLAMAAEYRDDATGEHTWRVGLGSALLARELGLSHERVELLRIAARLHDVGKIGIPDTLLLKPGRFTPEEFDEMKTHTLIGARLLSGGHAEVLRVAEEIALTHHERWDGQGYPRGLRGEQIPLEGRIVAVADVFDALMHSRPYKAAWSREDALAELVRQSGLQFDPAVVAAAVRVFGSELYTQELDLGRLHRPDLPPVSRLGLSAFSASGYSPASGYGSGFEDIRALQVRYEQLLHRQRERQARPQTRPGSSDPTT